MTFALPRQGQPLLPCTAPACALLQFAPPPGSPAVPLPRGPLSEPRSHHDSHPLKCSSHTDGALKPTAAALQLPARAHARGHGCMHAHADVAPLSCCCPYIQASKAKLARYMSSTKFLGTGGGYPTAGAPASTGDSTTCERKRSARPASSQDLQQVDIQPWGGDITRGRRDQP